MNQTKEDYWTNVLSAVLAVAIFVMIPIYYTFFDTVTAKQPDPKNDPRNKASEIKLQGELDKIQPMPGAVFLRKSGYIKFGGGPMLYTYSIDAKYTEVLRYYDLELRSKGWKFNKKYSEQGVFYVSGIKIAEYKKNSYTAEIRYREDGEGVIEFSLKVSTPQTY